MTLMFPEVLILKRRVDYLLIPGCRLLDDVLPGSNVWHARQRPWQQARYCPGSSSATWFFCQKSFERVVELWVVNWMTPSELVFVNGKDWRWQEQGWSGSWVGTSEGNKASCCTYFLSQFCCASATLSSQYRTRIREKYNLMEKPLSDFATHCFLSQCALCQEYRELKRFNVDLGKSSTNQPLLALPCCNTHLAIQ
jgi:Cys-rich protein (TIGR01571 family)